ncbi:MAG: hypothetical protein KA384_02880 [Leptotrichiaceae bacterium]|nr:hypothetical protein [Leptotrichiaceae bacterium]MBP7739189.1 hypothetical protein [Leptotrichiaceae bacterium]MBP9629657.1 hypothetical protein [Leptotrichiaceae bacterium]
MSQSYSEYKKEMGTKAKKKKTRTKKAKTKKVKTKGKSTAKKVAEKTLKENLRQEFQVSLTVDGSTKYMSGMIIELDESWGKFEGKYIIEKVSHSVTGDYTCDLECLKVGARENSKSENK